MKTYYYVYQITNWYNGKIYIGVHGSNNLNDCYFGSGVSIQRGIKKYGKEYFTKEIISFHETFQDALDIEAALVNEEFVKDSMTYNLKTGGIQCVFSKESKKKISNSLKGRIFTEEHIRKLKEHTFSEEHRRNLSESAKGKVCSEETKQRMSKAQLKRNKENPMSEESRRKQADKLKGKPLSEEHKKAISDGNKGKIGHQGNLGSKRSEETKQKLKEAWDIRRLTPMSEETKQKISNGSKKVWENEELRESARQRRIEFNKIFNSTEHICPHCGKIGKGPNMTRYHFDNCKLINGSNKNDGN